MTDANKVAGPYAFAYHGLRNISSPEDEKNGRRVLVGHAPIRSFIDLPDDDNVRTYIVTAEGKKRQRLTDVHRRIRYTLHNDPENFCVLNSGVVIVAREAEVYDKDRMVHLTRPSVINGSQTKGELATYLQDRQDKDQPPADISCKFEIIVTKDDDLIGEVSISRNFQNDVENLSIVGRKNMLEEIEERLQAVYPDLKLRKSETQRSDDYEDTEKLLQVITALMPASLWHKEKERDDPKKVYTYSMKSKCLREFKQVFEAAKNPAHDSHARALEVYQYYLDIAPRALQLYTTWKMHPGFIGTGIRAVERENGKVVDVPDGIIFPILASLSAFAAKVDGHWDIVPPLQFTDGEIIAAAKAQYMNVAQSNPWNMGKSQAIYSQLYQITSIYKKLSASA